MPECPAGREIPPLAGGHELADCTQPVSEPKVAIRIARENLEFDQQLEFLMEPTQHREPWNKRRRVSHVDAVSAVSCGGSGTGSRISGLDPVAGASALAHRIRTQP